MKRRGAKAFKLIITKLRGKNKSMDMKNFIVISILIILAVSCRSGKSKAEEKEEWIQLFNGKDLTGWDIKIKGSPLNENYKNTFRVEDGIMKVCYDEYEKFNGEYGHIFYKEPFSHYKLRIEYRFVGQQATGGQAWAFRNSGVMLHSQSAESMQLNQDFPVSIEAQFLGGDGVSERTTGNVCTPGTHIVIGDQLIFNKLFFSGQQSFNSI